MSGTPLRYHQDLHTPRYILRDPVDDFHDVQTYSFMSPESVYDNAIALSRTWLSNCLENHTSCSKRARHANIFCTDNWHFITDLSGDGLVPSRLLTFPIAPPPKGKELFVKLVESSELSRDTQYVALSHRWGSPEFPVPRTLEANLATHTKKGLRYEELPKTFRDAIDVTRAMGNGYLWIDSLCIIQDSPDDWKKEARRMAIIYDNAVFTIAAMDAENSSQGLFPTTVGCMDTLESRAWVCQERMLAPRTLMFAKNSVSWECRQASANSESPAFEQETDGTIIGCDKDDWVPPTRPKAIFAFFRDWRLPPSDSEDVDSDEDVSEGVVKKTDEEFDRHFDNLGDEKNTDPSDPAVDSEPVVVQEFSDILSMLNISGGDLGKGANTLYQDSGSSINNSLIVQEEDPNTPSLTAVEPAFLRNFAFNSSDMIEMTFLVQPGAESNSLTEESAPLFKWSNTEPPIKIWNARPPKGESGHFYNRKTGTTDVFYGTDLAAHANNLRSQKDSPVLGKTWKCLSDDAISDDKDLFGRFKVSVTHPKRPQQAYFPFIRVWWNFLALYTSRDLTYDSDAFLAINGITSVAQRWIHFRNSYGLWLAMIEKELCWYIDPAVPAVRPKTPQWLAPSWSWASTRGGLVKNAYWGRYSMWPKLLIKPYIEICPGTAFDMPLPLQAWRKTRYHALGLKGSLRQGVIKREKTDTGEYEFDVVLELQSRRSDHEVYKFYPDCAEDFPVDEWDDVFVLPFWHFDANDEHNEIGIDHHLDIMLVLKSVNNHSWVNHYDKDTLPLEEYEDDRTMRRLGLLETTYGLDEQRDLADIQEDWWLKYVRLL
jgi:hypothetical protein